MCASTELAEVASTEPLGRELGAERLAEVASTEPLGRELGAERLAEVASTDKPADFRNPASKSYFISDSVFLSKSY